MLSIVNQNVTLARAGAVANYINKMAIFCGGRSLQGVHKDCKRIYGQILGKYLSSRLKIDSHIFYYWILLVQYNILVQ